MITIPVPPHVTSKGGRDTRARQGARQALANVIWNPNGSRRLPREAELVAAITKCTHEDAWWVCEASSAGPVYFLPTREWMRAFTRFVDDTRARTVLEVAAGDGFLSACLSRARPKLRVTATDNHSWTQASVRMNAADKRRSAGVAFAGIPKNADVARMSATAAVKRFKPDLVVVSWPPPGTLVERVIRAPSKLVLEIGADGDVCGNGQATWRFEKEFLDGPLEERALCRLDARPAVERTTRVTLYYGKRHARFAVRRAPRRGAHG